MPETVPKKTSIGVETRTYMQNKHLVLDFLQSLKVLPIEFSMT